jgi:hypothetical protein
MYDPTLGEGGDKDGEWVEIYNNGCDPVNMTGWEVGDSDRRGNMTAFDGGSLTLDSGEYAVIIDNNAAANSNVTAFVNGLVNSGVKVLVSPYTFIGDRLVDNGEKGPEGNGLKDNGIDEVVISDENGLVVDRVQFNTTECGTAQDVSLERLESLGPSDCSNFGPSESVGGTPGRNNTNWILTECVCGTDPPIIPPCIVISEFLKTPDVNGTNDTRPDDEWVEIYNNGCETVDLSGWRLGDVSRTDGLIPLQIGDGEMTLEPDAFAVLVALGTSALIDTFPNGTKVFNVDSFQIGSNLNDDVDQLFLYDNFGNKVDHVRYRCKDDGQPKQNCPDGVTPGFTKERIISDNSTSFAKSTDKGGTPGTRPDGFVRNECDQCPPPPPPVT